MGALPQAQLVRISQMDSGSTLHLTNRPSRVTDGLIARSLLRRLQTIDKRVVGPASPRRHIQKHPEVKHDETHSRRA